MTNKLNDLENVISTLEGHANSMSGFKNILDKIDSLNSDSIAIKGDVNDSAQHLVDLISDLRIRLDAIDTSYSKIVASINNLNSDNKAHEGILESNIQKSKEYLSLEMKSLGILVNESLTNTNEKNDVFKGLLLKKIELLENNVNANFKQYSDENSSFLEKTKNIVIIVLVSFSLITAVNVYLSFSAG